MTSASLDAALSAAERRFIDANPRSRLRHERARAVLPGGHSRQTLYYAPFPLTVAHGEGTRITDLDGHEYLNLVGDFAAGVFGHRSEPIHQAVQQAMRSGISLSGPNTHEVELAELISQRIPSIQQVRFCNSGSEACLFAAQLARHAMKLPKLLVFNGAYHGGFMVFREGDAPLTVPIPVIKATYNDVPGTRALIRAHAAELAAVMVEPMMGSSGCIPGAPEFLAMLREETKAAGSQATGIGGVLNTHWCVGAISQPSQVQAAASPKRRLYHLCMLERGFYIAQRGMVNLSLPTTEADVAGFTRATREFLIEHLDALRLP